jgi:O-antigen ligase
MIGLARPRIRPTEVALIGVASSALAVLILVGDVSGLQKVWAAALMLCCILLVVWTATRKGLLTVERMDRWAWIVLLSHTVFTARIRDPRDILTNTSPTLDIAIEVAIWIVVFCYGSLRLLFDLRILRGLKTLIGACALIYLCLAAASAGYAASPVITLVWSFKLLTSILMALVLLYSDGPARPEQRLVSASYTGLVLMLAQFALLAVMSPSSAADRSIETDIWRLGGHLLPATQLSVVTGMIIVTGMVGVLLRRHSRSTLLLMGLSALTLLGTLGRSGMIATCLGLCFVLIYYRRATRLVGLALIGLLVLVAVPGLSEFAWDLISRKQSAEQISSLTGRVQIWEAALELIAERPLLGWGYVSGSRVAFLSAFRWFPAIHTHNAVIESLLTLGAIGTSVLLTLVILTFAGLKSLMRSAADNPSLVTMIGLLIVIVADGMFTSGVGGTPRFETMIFIGCALSIGAIRERNAS